MDRFVIPLVCFAVLAVFLAAGLRGGDPSKIPSPLIGKPAPALALPLLDQLDESKTAGANEANAAPPVGAVDAAQKLRGQVWLLNVWASWCVGCRVEHPALLALQNESGGATMVGLNYKDKPEDARAWLKEWGDPYDFSLADGKGDAAIDWGVYGVPETFVMDKSGAVRHKHIGPLDIRDVRETLLPLLAALQNEKPPGINGGGGVDGAAVK